MRSESSPSKWIKGGLLTVFLLDIPIAHFLQHQTAFSKGYMA